MQPGSAFNWGLPASASLEAPVIDFGIGVIHWAMVIMFIVWGSFMTWALIKFRARPGHRADPRDPSHATALIPDVLVVIFEVALIIGYGIPRWNEYRRHKPAEESATVIRIVAEQFAWNAHYAGPDGKFGRTAATLVTMNNPIGLDHTDPAAADDITSINEVAAPLGKTVLLYLHSKDVIHSFFVPAFRMKADTVPGLRVPLWFNPTAVGDYEIGCAQLCGIAHYAMRGDFKVLEPRAFDAWLKAQAKG